ncbi:MAG: hypothetical protein JRI68_24305 [Deltaproteobacteria bacterium]|nr:hypothetical protein [Deltaproteobacteria bacterium]
MKSTELLITLAGWAVAWVVSAAVLRGLVKNFRPQNPRNNWTTALLVTFAMSVIGAVAGVLAQGAGFVAQLGGLLAQVALLAIVYRIGVGLSIGIGFLVGIVMLAIAFGAALALVFLSAFGPAGVIGGLVVGIGAPVAVMIRNRRQEQKMIAAYGSDSIRQ